MHNYYFRSFFLPVIKLFINLHHHFPIFIFPLWKLHSCAKCNWCACPLQRCVTAPPRPPSPQHPYLLPPTSCFCFGVIAVHYSSSQRQHTMKGQGRANIGSCRLRFGPLTAMPTCHEDGHSLSQQYHNSKFVFALKLTNQQTTNSLHSEANSFSPIKKPSRSLLKHNVHYSLHNSRPIVTVLSQINSLNVLPNYILKIHVKTTPIFNLSKWFQVSPSKLCMHFSSLPYLPNSPPISSQSICSAMQITKLLIMLFPHRVVSPSFSLPRTFLSTLFSISLQASRDTTKTERRTSTTARDRIVVDQLLATPNWVSYVDPCTLDVNLRIQIAEEWEWRCRKTVRKNAGWHTKQVHL